MMMEIEVDDLRGIKGEKWWLRVGSEEKEVKEEF